MHLLHPSAPVPLLLTTLSTSGTPQLLWHNHHDTMTLRYNIYALFLGLGPGWTGRIIVHRWQGGGICGIQMNKGTELADNGKIHLCRDQSSDHKYPGAESYCGCFLHTLTLFALGPKKDFANCLSPTQGRLFNSHESEALGSLTWLHTYYKYTFVQGFTHSLSTMHPTYRTS